MVWARDEAPEVVVSAEIAGLLLIGYVDQANHFLCRYAWVAIAVESLSTVPHHHTLAHSHCMICTVQHSPLIVRSAYTPPLIGTN